MARLAAALPILFLLNSLPAAAQSASRPGPWALDVRGVTSPVPMEPAFYPALDSTTLVPGRGFGLDLGVHVYPLSLGSARLGFGADVFYVRATTKPSPPAPSTGSSATPAPAGQRVELTMRMLAPQISLNFGTREGWSYLSTGFGTTDVATRTSGVTAGTRGSSRLDAINIGGGARWFFKSHLAFGFDVRMHQIASGTAGQTGTREANAPTPAPVATPGMRILTVAVGFSMK